MESLIALDKQLFLFFNSYYSPFWDSFFEIFSGKIAWIPLAVLIIGIIIKNKGKQAFWILLFVAVTIALADQISVLIKLAFERPRPSREESLQGLVHIVNGHLGGHYGFVSSHAANSFAFALFSSLLFRWKPYTIIIFLWSVANSYSRIYLGLHYPADIIGGTLLGLSLGGIMFFAHKKLCTKTLMPVQLLYKTPTGFSIKSLYAIVVGLALSVITILFVSL